MASKAKDASKARTKPGCPGFQGAPLPGASRSCRCGPWPRCLGVRRARLLGLLTALLLVAVQPARATLWSGVEAGLSVDHARIELDLEGRDVQMKVSRLGIAIWEGMNPRLRLGLEGGPLRVTQRDNPATSGMELTGHYIALSAAGRLLERGRFALGLAASLGYHRADDDHGEQDIRLSWFDGRGELAITMDLTPLELSSGAYAYFIDGEETASGQLAHTLDFKAADTLGGFLSADYWVDATGRVSLRGDIGARRGVRLEFARRF